MAKEFNLDTFTSPAWRKKWRMDSKNNLNLF